MPRVYNLVANLLNVLGNYIFIYGKLGLPAMGAEGAALSTTLSRAIGCGIALYVVMSRRSMTHIIHVSLKADWRPDWQVIRQMLKIGAPATFEQFILQSGFMLFARTVSTLGTTVFAAHQIGLNINSLAFSPANAFGVAATTLVGQSIGRGETDVAMKQSKVIGHLSMAVNCLVGVLFLLVPQVFARLYTSDAEVIAMTCLCLRMIAVAPARHEPAAIPGGALRGAGDTLFPMIASVSGVWVFRVIVCYLMVNILGLGLFGAWLTMVMDQYLRAAIIMLRHRSGKWLTYKQRSLERRAQKKAQPSLVEIRQKAAWKAPSARLFLGRAAGWKARPFARGKLEGAAQQNRAAGKPPAKPGAFRPDLVGLAMGLAARACSLGWPRIITLFGVVCCGKASGGALVENQQIHLVQGGLFHRSRLRVAVQQRDLSSRRKANVRARRPRADRPGGRSCPRS